MLLVDTLCEANYLSNTYIVGDDKECLIIDPSNDIRSIKKLVNNRKVLGIFLTHGHFDHFKSLSNTLNEFKAKVFLQKNALEKLKNPNISCSNMFGYNMIIDLLEEEYQLINDGQKIVLNDIVIKVLSTPGHTNCSICLIIENMMFSGDTLFECGVGRSDLPTGNSIQLARSIKMLLNLKTDYIVYPGHGDKTSIFTEVKTNPYYQRIK